MSRVEVFEVQNCQDAWSKMYGHLAKAVVAKLGIEGEQALREGVRVYGSRRGALQRERHMAIGLKPNLLNLFTHGDVPTHKANPNFKRNKIKLTEQERLSETLCCPIAEVWIAMGIKDLGRIYCEEFHHAKFGTYNTKAQINLSQSLTQEGDDYCRFSIYLRPGNMTPEERKETFTDFDPGYKPIQEPKYEQLSFEESILMLFSSIAAEAMKKDPAKAEAAVKAALVDLAVDFANQLKNHAKALGESLSPDFISRNSPFSLNGASPVPGCFSCKHGDKLWKIYTETFCPAFEKALQ